MEMQSADRYTGNVMGYMNCWKTIIAVNNKKPELVTFFIWLDCSPYPQSNDIQSDSICSL